jgi:GT2 family glycosyltransferase/glycosyltransferase involved in cell wall biosynthesis
MTKGVVCIAGAHRSGTSMLTRLLHRSGLDLGPENDLMPAASDNPDGFWENLRFVQLNDEVLNAVGAAWDLPPWHEETFDGPSLQPMYTKAKLLIERFSDKAVWGWKDPRNCLTLPFWRNLLPGLKTVIIIRNPLEVAYSMHKRNGTSYTLGLRLWEIYNRRLLAGTCLEERVIAHYQAFFEEPEAELQKVATFAGLNGKDAIAAAALIAVNRRHTAFTIEQMIDAGVSEQIVALYRSLIDGTAERGKGARKKKRSAKVEDDQLSGAENRLNTSIPNGEDVRRELAARRGDEVQHREEVARSQRTIDRLREELAAKSVRAAAEINRRDGRIEELQKAYAHLDQLLQGAHAERNQLFAELERVRRESLEELNTARQQSEAARQQSEAARQQSEVARQQFERDQQEIAQLRQRFAQSNQLLQKTSIRLADFETRNTALTERLRKQLLEMKRLLRLLDQIDDAANLLRGSRRWKLANPFSALSATLSGKPSPGFGHLDKNVEKYRTWRSIHPEAAHLEREIQDLRPREIVSQPSHPPSQPAMPAEPATPIRPIKFAQQSQPEVSIIIPVFNQSSFTLACLAAVQEHTGDLAYEVIVVDDHSTDNTREVIGGIPGLIYLHVETNSGFIASCNRGAAAARGKFLVFLNNDTTVTQGWLSALRETFEFEPQAGLVGSKLVYPDGRLQEAGGIIWRDGSGWNRGKFQDPTKPEFNYLREVDYCSAASLMIPATLFAELGGFDPKYAPAYYEDTDLAFKVRQSGRKVLYQPLSVVLHHEGITSGTDISSGTKKYQEVNRATFTSAWQAVLVDKPENGDLVAYDRAKPGKKRILVIDHHLPMPDRDSGSLRMFQILNILQRLGHRVTFLPDNLANIPPYTGELTKRGIEVVYCPYVVSVRSYLEIHGREFDFVILSRCDFARKHIADVRQHAPQSRVIFDTVDLHFLREDREAALTKDSGLRHSATVKRQLEYELVDQADQTWVVSPVEKELLQTAHPGKSIEVLSNIVDVPGPATPFPLRSDFLFIGSFQHPPNIDAVLYFTREVFPLVQANLSAIKFFIIGDKPPPEVIALADQNIIITGYQPDVACYFERVRLSVAPLRFGAGVKGKVNQSMAFGVPVIATSIAVEGMDLEDHLDVLVADEPENFAAGLLELYQSQDLWEKISVNSVAKVRQSYSVDAARDRLQRLISEDALAPPSRVPNQVLSRVELRTVAAQR